MQLVIIQYITNQNKIMNCATMVMVPTSVKDVNASPIKTNH